MINKYLKIFVVINFLLLILLFLVNYKEKPKISIIKNNEKFNENFLIDKKFLDLVKEINKKNNKIESFISDCRVSVWSGSKNYSLNGKIKYKKLNFFKMEIYSFFGKELDIGSNKNIFWYWSKRDNRPALYWAYYKDFNKTRLKTPFDPIFMRSTLGFEKIEIKNVEFYKKLNNNYIISYKRENSRGEDVFFSVLLDENKIKGFLITNNKNNILSTCEIEWKNNMPKKIIYNWQEENKTMLIELKNSSTNIVLEENIFEIPNFKPKINMANE